MKQNTKNERSISLLKAIYVLITMPNSTHSHIEFEEELDDSCPPNDANHFTEHFLRLVVSYPSDELDFISPRAKQPNRIFKNASECSVRALSIFKSVEDAKSLMKIPTFKNCVIVRLDLGNDCGVLLHTPTPDQQTHHDWWKRRGYNAVNVCLTYNSLN
jgi:hypothetical protein